MHGWIGTILRVNLTNRTVKEEPLDPKLARQFIGAGGWEPRSSMMKWTPRQTP